MILDKRVPSGMISCTTSPPGAQVLLDGVFQLDRNAQKAVTPVTLVGAKLGIHMITFRLRGYRDDTQSVTVTEGKISEASAWLEAVSPQEKSDIR